MSLIQQVMPRWRLRQVDRVAVAADPARAYARARAVDLYGIPTVRRLFALRVLPGRIAAWLGGKAAPVAQRASIEQITAAGTGFHLIAERAHEVVVGSVGRFWQPAIEFAPVTASTFTAFDEPGWGKLAWSIAVAPREEGSWVSVELRVDCGDDVSWRKFMRYWRLIGPFSHVIRRGALRLLTRELGEASSDDDRPLAGDDLLPDARAQLTHAIDIEAPPAQVWPWLVQMGCQRAGWYSWDRLDNAGAPSADHIIPELQRLAVGDVVPARPTGAGGFEVLGLDPERALILGSSTPLFEGTWTFALEPIGDDATHLVTRYRAAYEPDARMAIVRLWMSPVHGFMERKQLRTIKQRVEASARPHPSRGRRLRDAVSSLRWPRVTRSHAR
jgi:hypothetical protein